MSQIKFIVAHGKVFFGDGHEEWHRDIATKKSIALHEVVGGGYALPDIKTVFGNSQEFGPYNQAQVQQLLTDWTVLEAELG